MLQQFILELFHLYIIEYSVLHVCQLRLVELGLHVDGVVRLLRRVLTARHYRMIEGLVELWRRLFTFLRDQIFQLSNRVILFLAALLVLK